MTVIGRVGADDPVVVARRSRADVVLLGQDKSGEADDMAFRLVRRLGLRVLTIADDGKRGALYELRPQRIAIGEVSARTLCNAIRSRDGDADDNPS